MTKKFFVNIALERVNNLFVLILHDLQLNYIVKFKIYSGNVHKHHCWKLVEDYCKNFVAKNSGEVYFTFSRLNFFTGETADRLEETQLLRQLKKLMVYNKSTYVTTLSPGHKAQLQIFSDVIGKAVRDFMAEPLERNEKNLSDVIENAICKPPPVVSTEKRCWGIMSLTGRGGAAAPCGLRCRWRRF